MEQEVFRAGVRPGGPSTQTEVKMLLCFILSQIESAMSFEDLFGALSEGALVNYFELIAALEQLEALGHLSREEGAQGVETYRATALGVQAGEELSVALPITVRERALRACERIIARSRRVSEVLVETQELESGGYQMQLSIPDEDSMFVSFSLHVPTQEQCSLIRRRFLNAPSYIYKGVLALLTGEQKILDEVFPDDVQQLF